MRSLRNCWVTALALLAVLSGTARAAQQPPAPEGLVPVYVFTPEGGAKEKILCAHAEPKENATDPTSWGLFNAKFEALVLTVDSDIPITDHKGRAVQASADRTITLVDNLDGSNVVFAQAGFRIAKDGERVVLKDSAGVVVFPLDDRDTLILQPTPLPVVAPVTDKPTDKPDPPTPPSVRLVQRVGASVTLTPEARKNVDAEQLKKTDPLSLSDPTMKLSDLVGTDAPVTTAPPSDAQLALEELKAKELEETLKSTLKSALGDPEVANAALDILLARDSAWDFLKDVDFKLKAFDADSDNGLGFSYAYDKNFGWTLFGRDVDADERDQPQGSVSGLTYAFSLHGNAAFDESINPQDFLESRLSFKYFRSSGGVSDLVLSDADSAKFTALSVAAAKYETDEQFLASPEWAQLTSLTQNRFSTQVYFDLSADAGLESNQAFTEKNFLLGAHAVLDVKAWNHESLASKLNLFDQPFALVRLLTGYDKEFTPRGSSWPTLLLGLDHVEPEGSDPRADVGDSSSYERWRAELGFKTPVARDDDNEYFFSASWRYYHELDASNAVEAADLDEFDYIALSLESELGMFITYAQGQLPLDVDEGEFVEVGWKFNF